MHGTALLMVALVGADVLVTAGIAVRLGVRGYLRHWGRPDLRLAREICGYGIRGHVGGMLALVNLRLAAAILGAAGGPGTLGGSARAPNYAALPRLPRRASAHS